MLKVSLAGSVQTTDSRAGNVSQLGVLLVRPELDLIADTVLLLTGAGYRVTTADSYPEVLRLHGNHDIELVILSDTMGILVLPIVARCVRAQWPDARILILGGTQSEMDDHLYDETLNHSFHPKEFLEVMLRLSEEPWSQKQKRLCLEAEGLSSHLAVPSESDPVREVPHNRAHAGNIRNTLQVSIAGGEQRERLALHAPEKSEDIS